MSDTPQARRASGFSISPLAAIALGFFLPTVRTCGVMERPVSYLAHHPHTAPWLIAPYLSAAIFAIATSILLVQRIAPARRAIRTGWVALGVSFLGTSATLMGWLSESQANTRLITWCIAMVCVGLIAVQRAVRFDGWSLWARFLLAQAALTAGNTVWIMVVTAMGDGAWDAVGIGGHLLVWSTIALAALAAYGIRAAVPPRP